MRNGAVSGARSKHGRPHLFRRLKLTRSALGEFGDLPRSNGWTLVYRKHLQTAAAMAKRIADKELTDRNWDQEEEGEEAGTFSIATDDVLKSRAIKKAKRRNTGGETDTSTTFKGFKGFSLTPSSVTAAFSGIGTSAAFTGVTNGKLPSLGGVSAHAAGEGRLTGLMFSSASSSDVKSKQTNGATPPSSASCSEYNKQLTALNCSVRDWITKHVNDNPLCDLNPIFRDYERHLASIERKYGVGSADGGCEEKKVAPPPAAAPSSSSSSSAAALFSFSRSPTEIKAPPGVTFNFGQKVDGPVLASVGSSPVLASVGSSPSPPGFSFASSPQSSLFGAAAAPSLSGARSKDAREAQEEREDEESDEPPKPEVKEVQEKDAFYSKKCKLFYKKDAEFKEKGVGTLHLKLTQHGKTQLIIRADTNLGNILLNIIVQASILCTRVGKNNVMLMCVPNPPVDEKNPDTPVPLLVRVKTAEDADELHKVLEEKKS
ncbi:nuclear pore complex protein Nup50 isoform X1 [Takifugu rubripes]|uniref:nuclear pore complex protein Nup50 isoform X1 n=1 Tax=Takifugu rubripes TaxID=31033 RepID=UPI0011451C86|nr:nuclear pore complex protein Nup50 isoform X1 [Takifugu rubripes]